MTSVKFRVVEAIGGATLLLLLFCLLHEIEGTRPLVTEFEAGGITALVILKCMEALRLPVAAGVDRSAVIEECAKIADAQSDWADKMIDEESVDPVFFGTIGNTANDIAKAIRALADFQKGNK